MEIAVFPIPDIVALPGQSHKIHVFEPRYREMLHDCLTKDRLIGLALPVKTGSLPPTAEPHHTSVTADMMGAGVPKILQTLPDGRLLVNIDIKFRVKVEHISQYLPYYLAEVSIVPELCGDRARAEQLVDELLKLAGLMLSRDISLGGDTLGLIEHRIRAIILWVTAWFDMSTASRQTLLEKPTAVEQGQFLVDLLTDHLLDRGIEPAAAASRRAIRRHGNLIEVDFRPSRI